MCASAVPRQGAVICARNRLIFSCTSAALSPEIVWQKHYSHVQGALSRVLLRRASLTARARAAAEAEPRKQLCTCQLVVYPPPATWTAPRRASHSCYQGETCVVLRITPKRDHAVRDTPGPSTSVPARLAPHGGVSSPVSTNSALRQTSAPVNMPSMRQNSGADAALHVVCSRRAASSTLARADAKCPVD